MYIKNSRKEIFLNILIQNILKYFNSYEKNQKFFKKLSNYTGLLKNFEIYVEILKNEGKIILKKFFASSCLGSSQNLGFYIKFKTFNVFFFFSLRYLVFGTRSLRQGS